MILRNGYNLGLNLNSPGGGGAANSLLTTNNALATAPAQQNAGQSITAPDSTNNTTPVSPTGNYVAILVGVIILLIGLKFASEHDKSGMDTKHIKIGVWSFIVIGIMSLLFIVGSKAIAGKYPNNPVSVVVLAA